MNIHLGKIEPGRTKTGKEQVFVLILHPASGEPLWGNHMPRNSRLRRTWLSVSSAAWTEMLPSPGMFWFDVAPYRKRGCWGPTRSRGPDSQETVSHHRSVCSLKGGLTPMVQKESSDVAFASQPSGKPSQANQPPDTRSCSRHLPSKHTFPSFSPEQTKTMGQATSPRPGLQTPSRELC